MTVALSMNIVFPFKAKLAMDDDDSDRHRIYMSHSMALVGAILSANSQKE